MRKVPYGGHINIRRTCTKPSGTSDLARRICAPVLNCMNDQPSARITWILPVSYGCEIWYQNLRIQY